MPPRCTLCGSLRLNVDERRPRDSRGFTLVELVVTIGVVVLLTGLAVTATTSLMRRSEAQQTERVLRLLDLAMQEWEATAGRQLTWWDPLDDPAHYDLADVHGDTPPMLIITEVLDTIGRSENVQQILGQLEPDLLYTYRAGRYPPWITLPAEQDAIDERFDGSMTVLDAWATPIYATHPGRPWTSADKGDLPRNPDGTIQTYNEEAFGVTRNRVVCFVSAGPDRQWGKLYEEPESDLFAQTRDNLHSYAPDEPALASTSIGEYVGE